MICARGVAPVTPSYVKEVICPAKDTIKKHLAPSAGFIKFCPRPPNNCFTIMIANTLPMIAIQIGNVDERFNASKSPVTAALPSLTVKGSFIAFCQIYSVSTQVAIQTTIKRIALISRGLTLKL